MITFLSKFYWRLFNWKITGSLSPDIKKSIMVVAPHTSWIDIFVGFAVRDKLQIHHAKFLGKKELFEGFYGKWLLNLGGIPVDRFAKEDRRQGVVDQAVRLYNENEKFIIGMSPEGTRKRVDKLKTGFYHIAKNAKIPIILVGFDYKNREVSIGNPIYTTEDEAADLEKIIAFFSTIQGAKPELDMRHLNKKNKA